MSKKANGLIVLVALIFFSAWPSSARGGEKVTETEFSVVVDYSATFGQMVGATHFKWVHPALKKDKNVQLKGEGRVERDLVLVRLAKKASTQEVLGELAQRGLKPAKVEDLLALSAANSDLPNLIVALGSPWEFFGSIAFPYITGSGEKRVLSLTLPLGGFDRDWDEGWEFLAIPVK